MEVQGELAHSIADAWRKVHDEHHVFEHAVSRLYQFVSRSPCQSKLLQPSFAGHHETGVRYHRRVAVHGVTEHSQQAGTIGPLVAVELDDCLSELAFRGHQSQLDHLHVCLTHGIHPSVSPICHIGAFCTDPSVAGALEMRNGRLGCHKEQLAHDAVRSRCGRKSRGGRMGRCVAPVEIVELTLQQGKQMCMLVKVGRQTNASRGK